MAREINIFDFETINLFKVTFSMIGLSRLLFVKRSNSCRVKRKNFYLLSFNKQKRCYKECMVSLILAFE